MTVGHPRPFSPVERRRRNREEMRNAILDTARAIMREHGVAALNLNEIARRIGVRTPSLYEYFPGKAALYDELFRLGVRLFTEESDAAMSCAVDFWSRVRAAFEAYLTFAQRHPELWALVFERHVPGFVPSAAAMVESAEELAKASRAIEEGIASGEIVSPAEPQRVRDLILAIMHGLAASHMANEPELVIGTGRFGSLISDAIDVLQAAWQPRDATKGRNDEQ